MDRRTFLRRGSLWVAGGLLTAEALDYADWQRYRRLFALSAIPSAQYDEVQLTVYCRPMEAVYSSFSHLPVAYVPSGDPEYRVIGKRRGVWEVVPPGTRVAIPGRGMVIVPQDPRSLVVLA